MTRALVCKPSVRVVAFTPALLRILSELDAICREDGPWPTELVITSINDSTHMKGSRHYTNEAVDIRTHNFSKREYRQMFREHLQNKLGPQFTVLLEAEGGENEHIHAQVRRDHTYAP